MECATVPAPSSSSPPPPLWDWDATATTAGEGKRARQQQGLPRCQVEGCGVELRGAKGYYRRHRVCEAHTKCPRVVVAGHHRRFCQQCSRFHALPEFDQNKRSCRRRLSDHNARRRKPQPDAFSFGSATLPPSSSDEERQISFMWEKGPLRHAHAKSISYSSSTSDLQLSQVMDIGQRSPKAVADSGNIHLSKSSLSYSFPTLCDNIDELLPIKGADASGAASKLAGALDVRRALSLLSASSWGLADPVHQTSSLIQFTNSTENSRMPPASYSGTIDGQPLALEPQVVQFTVDTGSTVFPDLERIKPDYDSTLFSMYEPDTLKTEMTSTAVCKFG